MTMKTTINILFAFAIALPIATYAQDKPKEPEKSSALIDSEKEFPVAEDEIDMVTAAEFQAMMRNTTLKGRDGVFKITWTTTVKIKETVNNESTNYGNVIANAIKGEHHVIASFRYGPNSYSMDIDRDAGTYIKNLEKFIRWSKTAAKNDVTNFSKLVGTQLSRTMDGNAIIGWQQELKFIVDGKGACYVRLEQDGDERGKMSDEQAVVMLALIKKIKKWKTDLDGSKKFDKLFKD
jgi:hypothetical protein